jgi:flagellar biosynthesis protein FliQ
MNADVAYEMIKLCLSEGMIIMSPLIVVVLSVGTTISVMQSLTSIQEQTLSFVPKMVAAASTLVLLGPWMLHRMGNLVILFFHRAGEIWQ